MSILSTLIVIFHHVHHISYNQLHVSFIATISRPSADVISKCSVIRGHVPISKAHQAWHVFISSISNSNQCMITTCRYDLKVWVIRCEDRANITGLCKLVQGFQICFWIHLENLQVYFWVNSFSPLLLGGIVQTPGLEGCWRQSSPWSGSWSPQTCFRWFRKAQFCLRSSLAPSGRNGQEQPPQGTCHSSTPQPRSSRWHTPRCQRSPRSWLFQLRLSTIGRRRASCDVVATQTDNSPLAISGFRSSHADTRVQRVHDTRVESKF